MSLVEQIDRRIRKALSRYRLMIDSVTNIVHADDGTATGEGIGESDLEMGVGWQFGFYSRPNDGGAGVAVKIDGNGNSAFLLSYRDTQYEMTLEKGECGMKNAFDASILLDQNGDIIANSKTGRTVQVNGSTYSMPKWDDFATVLKAATQAVSVLTPATDPATVITLANGIQTAFTTLNTAMGTNTNYKSTKAKNG